MRGSIPKSCLSSTNTAQASLGCLQTAFQSVWLWFPILTGPLSPYLPAPVLLLDTQIAKSYVSFCIYLALMVKTNCMAAGWTIGSDTLWSVKLIKMKLLNILVIILTGLWLSACTHTGSPNPTIPEQEKPAENTSESRTAPSETTDSRQQESGEKSQTNQPPAQPATGPESKNTAENRPASETNSADAANAKL